MTYKGLKPVPPLDPELFADHSTQLAIHEGGHVAANHILGRETISAKIRLRSGCTTVRLNDDSFGAAVTLLTPTAFERHVLGVRPTGSRDDLRKAEHVLARRFSGQTLDSACDIVGDAAITLAKSKRFKVLTYAVARRLKRESYLTATEIREILKANDPETEKASMWSLDTEMHGYSGGPPSMAPVSRVLHSDGTVSLWSHGLRLVSRGSEAEVESLSASILSEVWR